MKAECEGRHSAAGGHSESQSSPPRAVAAGVSNHKALSYQQPTDTGYSFLGYAKQTGPKWLKVLLFGCVKN